MAEQQHAARTALRAPAESASTSDSELDKRLEEFIAYVGNHEYSRGQAVALLQLAVNTAEPAPTKKSIQLDYWLQPGRVQVDAAEQGVVHLAL